MSMTSCNCAHVVSFSGEPLGVITLQDICKYLIIQEAKQKMQYQENHLLAQSANNNSSPGPKTGMATGNFPFSPVSSPRTRRN
jgi:hypothetical protein